MICQKASRFHNITVLLPSCNKKSEQRCGAVRAQRDKTLKGHVKSFYSQLKCDVSLCLYFMTGITGVTAGVHVPNY